jgi:hypothetical protein
VFRKLAVKGSVPGNAEGAEKGYVWIAADPDITRGYAWVGGYPPFML